MSCLRFRCSFRIERSGKFRLVHGWVIGCIRQSRVMILFLQEQVAGQHYRFLGHKIWQAIKMMAIPEPLPIGMHLAIGVKQKHHQMPIMNSGLKHHPRSSLPTQRVGLPMLMCIKILPSPSTNRWIRQR